MNKEDGYLTYLGDGVYATFDGYQIWLKVGHSDRTMTIALEPETYHALVDYWTGLQVIRREEQQRLTTAQQSTVDNEG